MIRLVSRLRRALFPKAPSGASVREDGLTYLSLPKCERVQHALATLQERAVPGDFLEFGVALGGSAILIAAAGKGRRFHGFDVFEMIPAPTSEKDDEKSRQRYETIKEGRSKGLRGGTYYGYRPDLIGDVKRAFASYGLRVDGDRIQLHRGLFEETWPRVAVDKVAFAHIDCDWYDPVQFCLNAIADIMARGGVIVIDDYHDYGGCRVAVDEFMNARTDFSFEDGPNPILRKIG